MALNIPMPELPLSGLNQAISTGGNLFSQMINPVIERENAQRQWRQHLDSMALQREQMGHARRNDDIQRALLEQQLLKLQHSNDPMYELNQYKMLEDFIKKGGNPSQNAEEAIPTQEMGQGMGMFSPEGLKNAQQMSQENTSGNNAPKGGLDLELLKSHPMLRGWAKKHLGYDPLQGESNVLHGPARDAADLEKLRNQVGSESPVYKNAKAAYEAQMDAKRDLRDLRARTRQGLKPGEKEFFDANTGEPLGKEIPLTSKERESEEGNILFNELYPYVYKGAAPFSGEGSIQRLHQAAANYKTDPNARKLFDDFLLADKMLAATTVNEASTLKAGRTNRTYNMLRESLEAQDVPKMIKRLIKQYGLPASAQLRASMRYQELLSNARKKARKGTPATQRLFYNPELQAEHESQVNEEQPHSNEQAEIKEIGGKKYKKIEGEWHEVE
jgi:hypothetical protein